MTTSKQSRILDSIVFITEYCCYYDHTPGQIKTLAEMFVCQLILEKEKEAATQILKLINSDQCDYLHLSDFLSDFVTSLTAKQEADLLTIQESNNDSA